MEAYAINVTVTILFQKINIANFTMTQKFSKPATWIIKLLQSNYNDEQELQKKKTTLTLQAVLNAALYQGYQTGTFFFLFSSTLKQLK